MQLKHFEGFYGGGFVFPLVGLDLWTLIKIWLMNVSYFIESFQVLLRVDLLSPFLMQLLMIPSAFTTNGSSVLTQPSWFLLSCTSRFVTCFAFSSTLRYAPINNQTYDKTFQWKSHLLLPLSPHLLFSCCRSCCISFSAVTVVVRAGNKMARAWNRSHLSQRAASEVRGGAAQRR